jgi:spore coat protein U-like protein
LPVICFLKTIFGVLLSTITLCASGAVNCGVSSTAVAFGDVPLLAGVTSTAEGEVRVRCEVVGAPPMDNQVGVSIKISSGNSPSFSPRQLFNAGGVTSNHRIDYNLYAQASIGPIWGDGLSGTISVAFSIVGLSSDGAVREVARTIYGRIPPITTGKKSGAYGDLLLLTVDY